MINKRKISQKLLSLLMAASLLLQSGSIPTYGKTGEAAPQDVLPRVMGEVQDGKKTEYSETEGENPGGITEAVEKTEPVILTEIEAQRDTHTKEYLLSDQSHAIYLYPEPVHYENEEGQLLEIDNTLVETKEGYENGDNSYELLITDNEESRGEVIYREDDYVISWQMVEQLPVVLSGEVSGNNLKPEESISDNGLLPEGETLTETGSLSQEEIRLEVPEGEAPVLVHEMPDPALLESEVTEVQDTGEAVPETETKDATYTSGNTTTDSPYHPASSVITFSGYDRGVRLEYSPGGDGIKENIILPDKNCPREYTFRVKTQGLSVRLNDAGEVEFYDPLTDEILL